MQDKQAAAQMHLVDASHAATALTVPSQQPLIWEKVGFLYVPFSPSADGTTGARHLPGTWATQK